MKASEINLTKDNFTISCNTYPARSHYKFRMSLGRVFPSTKAQAHYFVSNRMRLDVLNYDDVQIVESILNKHGFEGQYSYTSTKSKHFVRLKNSADLRQALKSEFDI